jgi:outer membrane receptor protein involved in Fe transport
MIKHTHHILFTMIACLWLQTSNGQKILLMDLIDNEPITDVEVIIFKGGEKELLITNSVGVLKYNDVNQIDSIVAGHTSYETTKISYKELVKNGYTIYMLPLTDLLPDIIIRGIPDGDFQMDQPIKIDRIRPVDVKFHNPQTAADLVGMSNKIYVQKSQMGGGSPMIRGFAANNVLIVVDGVRMNNAIFRDGNLQNIITIDPSIINETEIFYGPGSVIYGSDAMGGVMAFQTKTPSIDSGNHYKGNVMLRTASANKENSWHVDLEYGKNKFAGMSSLSLSNYSDLKMGSKGPIEYTRPIFNEYNGINDSIIYNDDPDIQYFTGYTQININQKFRYKPSEKNDFILQFGYTTSSPITRYDRLLQMVNGQLKYGDWYYGPQKWAQANLRFIHQFSDGKLADKLILTAAYQQFIESRHERLLFSKNLDSRTEKVDAYTLNADFDKKFRGFDFTYGLEVAYNVVGSEAIRTNIVSGLQSAISTRYPDGSTWYNSGIYASMSKSLGDNTQLSLGARYSFMGVQSSFEQTFYDFPFDEIVIERSALNGSLGLVTRLTDHLKVFVNASSGFRAPNVDDAGKIFDSEPGKVVVPNSNLLPEYSYSAEVGLNIEIEDRFMFSANAYYTLVSNLIVRDKFTLNGEDSLLYTGQMLEIQSLVNSNRGQIYGTELSMNLKIHQNIELKSSINYISGEAAGGMPIRHITPNFGNTSINFQYRRFRAQVYSNYNLELSSDKLAPSEVNKSYLYLKDDQGLPYSPAWTTFNIKTGFYFSSSLKLNVGVENIFNIRYRPYSSGLTAPGRNLILSINGRF